MNTGETNNDNALPRAADVLREAYGLARSITVSQVELDRAALLLGIARELREGARRVPAIVVGDNVPDEVVSVIEQAAVERDAWRSKAEQSAEVLAGARREIADLLRQGNEWRRRAEEFGWREGLLPPFPAEAPVSAPLFDTVQQGRLDHGQTYETLGEQSERVDLFAYGAVTTRDGAEYSDPIAAVVDEATRAVPVVEARPDAARRTWPLVSGFCDTCGGETYEAVTATGREARHRETGTPNCPDLG